LNQARTLADIAEWGVASHAYPGQRVCGDAWLMAPFEDGVLAAVVDGLGHGKDAAEASQAAVVSLAANAGRALSAAVARCHADLRRTRGAALSLAAIDAAHDTLTWVGVGNVEAVLFSSRPGAPRQTIIPRAGVVGYQLPPLREASMPIMRGDVLILASDGVSSRFHERPPRDVAADAIARALLDAHGRADDDALVLVVRYLGAAS
jgi:serine/threonine protein phosphatase PrpC